MKYLKKIFENDNSIRMLLNAIDAYNDLLKNDKIWQDYYKDFENWRKSSNDSRGKEFLEEVIKFAEKRIEEIKAEFQKDLDFVKDLYLNYLDDCESFSDYSIRRMSLDYEYMIELRITFSERTLKNRRHYEPSVSYKITNNEVLDYWKNIYDFFIVLKSYGYLPRIDYYQPNGGQMVIIISKDEN